ncbi:MAG: phosphotransferase [Acidimicrobiia bacterium]|nr:phosphotransferase [Acidimicrobiia bacterium]MYG71462.1 phosphotransferase [Acidimicrobiia bacterium]MYH95214.1 phosphotransferase [Acidimicrobiia bacterium]MYL09627.1 phosphotransferase [Acidimicrobiia bacterium]
MGSGSGEGEMIAGKVTEFVRVGDEVLRPATANSESMRQLLAHLEECGFEGAPQVVGSEPDGAVRLTWIEGWVPDEAEAWKLDAEALESVGQLLRQYHDSVRGFAPKAGFEEGPQAVAEGDIVCHGDIAPRNTVFRDGWAVAFIDWDGIWIAPAIWDLGHALWQFAPICDDDDPLLQHWPAPPDRTGRITALVRGYRLAPSEAQQLPEMVCEVIAGCHRSVARKAAAGIPAFARMEREGTLEVLASQLQAAQELRPLIQEAVLAGV